MTNLPDPISIAYRPATTNEVRSWSFGAVATPCGGDLSLRAKGALGDQRIFGPIRAYECECGKYRGLGHNGTICDICGVRLTSREARHERCGHINLPSPLQHPLGESDKALHAWPVLPASYFESDGGAPLVALYDRTVAAASVKDIEGIRNNVERIAELLLPVLTQAHLWRLTAAPILAQGVALVPREAP